MQPDSPQGESDAVHKQNTNKPSPNPAVLDLLGYIVVEELTPFEQIERHFDNRPGLAFRKALMRLTESVRNLCRLVIYSHTFEAFIILVILANSVMLAVQGHSNDTVFTKLDRVFLCIYSVECVMKVSPK